MKKLISITSNLKKIDSLKNLNSECLVIGINEDRNLNEFTKILDNASSGSIKKLLKRQELTGKLGNQLYLPELNGFKANKVYFIGLGKKNKELNEDEFSSFSSALSKITISADSKNIDIFLPEIKVKSNNSSWVIKIMARDLESGCYQYFFDGKKEQPKNKLKKINFLNLEGSQSKQKLVSAIKVGQIIGAGMNTSKNLANTCLLYTSPSPRD